MLFSLRALSVFGLRLPLLFASQLLTTPPAQAQQSSGSDPVAGWSGVVSVGPAAVSGYAGANSSKLAPSSASQPSAASGA